jgi:micrococcal nuclease
MYEYLAEVDRIIDGDTVDFNIDLGFSVSLKIRGRLAGCDTPERGHQDFKLATEKCRELLERARDSWPFYGKIVLKTSRTGKYGRWIVEIQGVTDVLSQIWPYKQ